MTGLLDELTFTRGPAMKNRLMLAPLTNLQSHADGTLSEEEFHWLTLRAQGGFGLTMTCASHVQAVGIGFPGQLGIFGDQHLEGLARLAREIKRHGSVAICQLHHAGMRTPAELIDGVPVCPSADEKSGARALSAEEVAAVAADFVAAAARADQAGFDGVELHGAHGYLICQFLSPRYNRRDDDYGGSAANRARLLLEIIEGVRRVCRPDFCVGVRLSPERFGLQMSEILELAQRLTSEGQIDFLDMSLWDVFKEPEETDFAGKSLLAWFTELDRQQVRLVAAGKIRTAGEAARALDAGLDAVMLGRAAILHHDYPQRLAADPAFEPLQLPVSAQHLQNEGVSEKFLDYLRGWEGFVVG